MTYYIEIRKRRRKKQKAKFWESDVIEKKTEIVDGEVKERKRSGRYGTKTRYEKNVTYFFCGQEVVNFFTPFPCIEFHSINDISIENNNFDELVKIFMLLSNFLKLWSIFLQILDYGTVM